MGPSRQGTPTHQSCGLGRFLPSNSPGLALPDGAGFQRCPPPPLWDADVKLHLLLETPWNWLQMTEAGCPQGFPKMHKERKADGPGRNGQRTVRGESPPPTPHPREQLCTYLGKSCRRVPPLYAFFPGRHQPCGGVWSMDFFFFFFSQS